ncbi:35207_t:CDS:1, partial [Gigaspora margarita]
LQVDISQSKIFAPYKYNLQTNFSFTKMPKLRKINVIRTYRHSKGLTISFVGDINVTITLKNNLKKSEIQTKADLATITLQHFNKTTNYYTTFELNQVTYNKSNKILRAKNGKEKIIKSTKSKLNEKTEK